MERMSLCIELPENFFQIVTIHLTVKHLVINGGVNIRCSLKPSGILQIMKFHFILIPIGIDLIDFDSHCVRSLPSLYFAVLPISPRDESALLVVPAASIHPESSLK